MLSSFRQPDPGDSRLNLDERAEIPLDTALIKILGTPSKYHQVWDLGAIALHLLVDINQTLINALEAAERRGIIKIFLSGGMRFYELAEVKND